MAGGGSEEPTGGEGVGSKEGVGPLFRAVTTPRRTGSAVIFQSLLYVGIAAAVGTMAYRQSISRAGRTEA
jgi:hypothetical protein